MHFLKMCKLSKNFSDTQISYAEKGYEFSQKVSRKVFVEQGGTCPEGRDLHLDDRPCGKGEKLPPGDEAKDHSRLGLEAFREGEDIRKSEMRVFPSDWKGAHDWRTI